MRRALGELRIIGGAWRSRRIAFEADDAAGFRATPDRVRQTVYDWLTPIIDGASVLDLFAGSGALGLEALSRGAANATFIDSGGTQCEAIRAALVKLAATDRADVQQRNALEWLESAARAIPAAPRFDAVFVDPPFQTSLDASLIEAVLPLLPPLLKPWHRVYLEWPAGRAPTLPPGWAWQREKQAGGVGFGLVIYSSFEAQESA